MRWSHALGIVAVAAYASGAQAAAAQRADLAARAEAIVNAAYPADGPGAAIIITRGGRTLYTGGRGLADLDARRPITPDTVFPLASITKQFTAAVVLQLVQEGSVSLDDPLTRFFPDYPQPGGSATVRQLLSHTSGIQNYTSIPGFMEEANTNRPYTTAEKIALFRDLPSPTPPGQAWVYNNSGYVLLGAIVEQVTGKPWHQAIEERIARPLGLRSIGYRTDRQSAPDTARGYALVDGAMRPAQRIHPSAAHAGGGLVGSVRDLARWGEALRRGRVVAPALYQAMITPTALPGGRTHPYGFGFELNDVIRGRAAIGHGGGIFGFVHESVYVPSEDLFVAVLSNNRGTSPSLVAKRLAAIALGDPYPDFARTDVPQQTLAPLFGVYRIGDGEDTRRFYGRDGRLFTMKDGAPETEVFAAGEDRFFYGPASLTWFRIARRPGGNHVMEMYPGGGNEAERAVRTGDSAPPASVDRATLQSYVGRYTTPGPAVTIAMREDGVLTLQLGQRDSLAIRPLSPTEFLVERVGVRIVFHPENGAVNRLVIHQGSGPIEARRTP